MNYSDLVKFVQEQFTDGLALVIGSGLSAAEGIPGMPGLAQHLMDSSDSVPAPAKGTWSQIVSELAAGAGLESALHKHRPAPDLEAWVARETAAFLMPHEKSVLSSALRGDKELRLTTFLSRILKAPAGLPILTPNYDRLIEAACEMAGFHVDSTAVGHYAGAFDHKRSSMGSCRGIARRAKTTVLDHFPRAVVLKPHGSFDWYKVGNNVRRCSIDLDAERLIITPGINKYRAGYSSPFDQHRELANQYIRRATRLLVIGYGFNDDHLQTHLVRKIEDGTSTLILNRSLTDYVQNLADTSPRCVCLSSHPTAQGAVSTTAGSQKEHEGPDLWDLGVLAKETLT